MGPDATRVPLMHRVMARAAENLVPLQACLELTYRCNLRCKHCYIDPSLRRDRSDELSLAEWCDVFDQLQDAGTLSVLLTGGEIFTRPDALDIAFEAKERGFMVWLATNGTLIDSAIAREVRRLRAHWVAVSLYGASAETHEAVTGVAGSFEATLRGIRLLREVGVGVTVQAMLMDTNVEQGIALFDLATSLDVGIHIGYELVPTKHCALSPQQYETTFEQLEAYMPMERLLGGFPIEGAGMCKAGRAVCAISPTGEVVPCLLMPLKIGDIRASSFRELWRDDPAEELVDLRSVCADDLTECRDCSLAPYCNRCPGVALAETGSVRGRAPSACRHAAMRARIFDRDGGSYEPRT